ncbi:MAG TPA: MFS transporter [Candidatus Woesearchaeota archaeon]|nr:MFS transporter [Candidatus Woesearchaeota archaeon]
MNAVSAAIVFLYLFGRSRIGLTIPEYMLVFCLFSVTAIFGALYFGRLSDRLGSKKALTIAVILWGIVILVLIFVSNFISFMFAGLIGGVAWGAVIACVRPLLLDIAPKNKIGEYFGFAEMANKFSGIIGPIAFGALVVVWNYSAALVLLLLFFIVGGVFLQKCRGH